MSVEANQIDADTEGAGVILHRARIHRRIRRVVHDDHRVQEIAGEDQRTQTTIQRRRPVPGADRDGDIARDHAALPFNAAR